MIDLIALLTAFRDGTGAAAAVWLGDDSRPPTRIASSVPALGILGWTPPLENIASRIVESPSGPVIVARIPGPHKAWIVAGPSPVPQAPDNRLLVPAEGTGYLDLTLFNQPWAAGIYREGLEVAVSGTVAVARLG